MEKPNIDTQSKRMMVKTETYSEMIDVLIRHFLAMKDKDLSKDDYERFLRTENVLEKAGVEFETDNQTLG